MKLFVVERPQRKIVGANLYSIIDKAYAVRKDVAVDGVSSPDVSDLCSSSLIPKLQENKPDIVIVDGQASYVSLGAILKEKANTNYKVAVWDWWCYAKTATDPLDRIGRPVEKIYENLKKRGVDLILEGIIEPADMVSKLDALAAKK